MGWGDGPWGGFAWGDSTIQVDGAFIDQSGVTFAPTSVVLDINLGPMPPLLGADQSGGNGYQLFAPRRGWQLTIPRIDQAGVLFNPSRQSTSNIFPSLINQSGTLFSPMVAKTINPGFIDQSGTTFAPGNLYPFNRDEGSLAFNRSLIRQARLRARPDEPKGPFRVRSTDGNSTLRGIYKVRGRFHLQSTPPVLQMPLIDQSGVLFNPSGNIRQVLPPLLDQSGTTFAPNLYRSFAFDLIDQSGVLFDPTVQIPITVSPNLYDQAGVLFSPAVNPRDITILNFIDLAGELFSPSFGTKVNPGLLDQSGVLFGPNVANALMPLIDQSGVLFEPNFTSPHPPLLDQSGVVFAPQVFLAVPNTVRFDDDPSQFLDQAGVVFAPTRTDPPPVTIFVDIIDRRGTPLPPVVVQITHPTVYLTGRWTPNLNLTGRHKPALELIGRESSQG